MGTSISLGFSIKKYKIIAYDIDKQKIESIIRDPKKLFDASLEKHDVTSIINNIFHVDSISELMELTDFVFITVPTPTSKDGKIDLTAIKDVSNKIGVAISDIDSYKTVIVKSTVIPGTTRNVVKKIIETKSSKVAGKDFGLVMNPEFLREGSALSDFLNPDRIVVGSIDERSYTEVARLYSWASAPILKVTLEEAEAIKYASNSFLALKISFVNELANYCEKIGVDVRKVIKGMTYDKRISPYFLNPGVGFGGSCFPKDVKALHTHSVEVGSEMKLLGDVLDINSKQPLRAVELLKKEHPELKNKVFTVWGLSFKPGTNDVRNSPAFPIMEELLREGAVVKAHDPVAISNAKKVFSHPNLHYVETIEESLLGSNGLIVVTAWPEYVQFPLKSLKKKLNPPLVVDGRGIYYETASTNQDIIYYGIGWKNNNGIKFI